MRGSKPQSLGTHSCPVDGHSQAWMPAGCPLLLCPGLTASKDRACSAAQSNKGEDAKVRHPQTGVAHTVGGSTGARLCQGRQGLCLGIQLYHHIPRPWAPPPPPPHPHHSMAIGAQQRPEADSDAPRPGMGELLG